MGCIEMIQVLGQQTVKRTFVCINSMILQNEPTFVCMLLLIPNLIVEMPGRGRMPVTAGKCIFTSIGLRAAHILTVWMWFRASTAYQLLTDSECQ